MSSIYFACINNTNDNQVNASYVYGLSLIPIHMRRALGTLTTWETFSKATEVNLDGFQNGDDTIHEDIEEATASMDSAII
jgi:hypothetical protein